MHAQSQTQRFVILHLALPLLFVAPEVINLGVIFLRWDYLVILYVLLSFAVSSAQNPQPHALVWRQATTLILLIYVLCSVLMVMRLGAGSNFMSGVKYASWPMKVFLWAVGVWFVFVLLKAGAFDLYRMLAVLVLMILAMQLLELTFPAFRDWSFRYYPVASVDRLRDLGYRARGPFNGYDTTSLFFVLTGVFFNEFARQFRAFRLSALGLVLLSCVGAFLAARTGLMLIVLYLILAKFARGHVVAKILWVLLVGGAILFMPDGSSGIAGQDTSLMGRYLEVLQALLRGDLFAIQSLSGTFHMNAILMAEEFDFFWGTGLSAATTADQLYFKYLYMFGQVGLVVWGGMHLSLYLICRSTLADTPDRIVYRNTALAMLGLIALAHIKGGNYFFAARLGEYVALILILSTVGRPSKGVCNG